MKNNEKILKELDSLIDFSEPQSIRRSLTEVFFVYLISNHTILPHRFEAIASDFHYLLKFIDALEKNASN